MKTLFVAVLALLPITASAAPRPTGLVVSGWARPTTAGQTSGAAYLVVRNYGPSADRLLTVTTPLAGMASVHRSELRGGVSRMRNAGAIVIPAGKMLTMGPNGYHVMLMGLRKPLQPGTTLPLTLRFERAGSRQLNLPIQMSAPR